MLALQHNMAGFNGKSKAEISSFYMKIIALLTDECAEWIKGIEIE
jgi:hypothetical protein